MKQLSILIFCILTLSCNKFLEEPPDKKLVIPSTLADLQALLDNVNLIVTSDPYFGELGSDDFYLNTATWLAQTDYDRNAYVWQNTSVGLSSVNDWSSLYTKVYYANTVLENIEKIQRNTVNGIEWDNLKGQALMIRGKAFLQAVLLWAPAYDSSTADKDLGIPLRLSTNFSETSTRSSVKQTYIQILADLSGSLSLLPNRGMAVIRSCKAAAYGLLSRTCLNMFNYTKAGLYADSSLQINSLLLNYNGLNTTATNSMPVPPSNPEVVFFTGFYNTGLSITNAKVDSVLYNSYQANDYRKTILFRANTDGSIAFKGTYIGATGNFSGIASDEMFLTRAECYARGGNINEAMADLNTLLKMRYKTGSFIPFTAGSSAQALDIILKERRKELLFRGLRWMDIKRLNKEGANIILKRVINNEIYSLPPNDLRYALLIPEYVIDLTGMPQNPR